ncbi:MAG TPA: HAD-IB family phosphatase [Gemmatimonadaceae bacterium]|nr:HAD-IB family phosphatase [Gemmatimonadaceae bacterium]
MSAYAAVVLDMDSTLAFVEGIDWLARRRDPSVAREIEALTARAMDGELALDDIYGERLALIRPSEVEIDELALRYESSLAPGAIDAIARLRDEGVALVIVSGGILQALLPAARALGFADTEVHAVRVDFDSRGEYAGFDSASPLATQHGKVEVVRALSLPRPLLAVGDGSTDAALLPVVDSFAAFTGFVRREPVVAVADSEVRSFDDILQLVLA